MRGKRDERPSNSTYCTAASRLIALYCMYYTTQYSLVVRRATTHTLSHPPYVLPPDSYYSILWCAVYPSRPRPSRVRVSAAKQARNGGGAPSGRGHRGPRRAVHAHASFFTRGRGLGRAPRWAHDGSMHHGTKDDTVCFDGMDDVVVVASS